MVLTFAGGVRPTEKTRLGSHSIKNIGNISAVCIKAGEFSTLSLSVGAVVKRGTLLGESDETPVYSSIAGRFGGLLEVDGTRYFVVMNSGEEGEEEPFQPETRPLRELGFEDILESAKKLAVIDSRSGTPLWRLLENARKCRRVVVDCTESDPLSASSYRICLENTKQVVGGMKILLKATGALKGVFAVEYTKDDVLNALSQFDPDEKLLVTAPMDEKYPYSDRALMDGIYVRTLGLDQTALDQRVLIVGAETAVALYNAMATGAPHLDQVVSICGDGLEGCGNYQIPRGATMHDITNLCGKAEEGHVIIENSLLCGSPMQGALKDGTRALISVKPQTKTRNSCINCGECAKACPVYLMPFEALTRNASKLRKTCVGCGACQFVCPSGIPLLELIQKGKSKPEKQKKEKKAKNVEDDYLLHLQNKEEQ